MVSHWIPAFAGMTTERIGGQASFDDLQTFAGDAELTAGVEARAVGEQIAAVLQFPGVAVVVWELNDCTAAASFAISLHLADRLDRVALHTIRRRIARAIAAGSGCRKSRRVSAP